MNVVTIQEHNAYRATKIAAILLADYSPPARPDGENGYIEQGDAIHKDIKQAVITAFDSIKGVVPPNDFDWRDWNYVAWQFVYQYRGEKSVWLEKAFAAVS